MSNIMNKSYNTLNYNAVVTKENLATTTTSIRINPSKIVKMFKASLKCRPITCEGINKPLELIGNNE